MLQIHCSGSPYEIGRKHGKEAKAQIARCMSFYAGLFQKSAKMDWTRVQEVAMTFEQTLFRKWPTYLEEMRGVADGACVQLADIIALNVRTEIAFGMFSDGCTALSWKTDYASYLAQNWDWMEAQKENLIILTIEQADKPTIKMVTEAGLIGKIGMNSAGVGVCLNAIRAKGMDPTRLPCHLGLRMVLDSWAREEAVQRLEKSGIASSCHMLVADPSGGVGLEWSSTDLQKVTMNAKGQVFHTNHYLLKHPGIEDTRWIGDSSFRISRIEELCKPLGELPTSQTLFELFKDEANYPGSICRAQIEGVESASLFNIVMDLHAKVANVTLGRPVAVEEVVQLAF